MGAAIKKWVHVMEIRELEQNDLPDYLNLLKVLDEHNSMSLTEAEQLVGKIRCYPYYKIFLILNEEGQITGTFSLIICDNFGHGGLKFAIVENVVVHPEFRSQGIGKAMMLKAREIASENNCYKLMLSSNETRTEAHSFYENIGFERHGVSFRTELINK